MKSNSLAVQVFTITRNSLCAITVSLLPRQYCTACLFHDNLGGSSYRYSPPYNRQFSVHHLGSENYSIFEDWKGSSAEEHVRKRSKKGDTEDVHSEAAASGLRERRTNQGLADETKSQGMTERGGTKYGKKAKEEHPKAPEPVIGMNDERAKVSS
ncbi:hypothetical protein N7519_011486 [Penicillium mononematosum]|uniref:uncharacterized protein n=1 Tax=Penicillium mononematosum TaxID=268346 RepID=UPI0025475A75|nr:uncharacterized protein N7519_011486 [Penicillium mononematosum]KAJ6181025.1 hypothetical protein N7519_011486 [Penicillium mononematosum]